MLNSDRLIITLKIYNCSMDKNTKTWELSKSPCKPLVELKRISILDFFNPKIQPGTFQTQTFQPWTFQPWIFEPWSWKVHGWNTNKYHLPIRLKNNLTPEFRLFKHDLFNPIVKKIMVEKSTAEKFMVEKVWGWSFWLKIFVLRCP